MNPLNEDDNRPFTIVVSEKGGAERRQAFHTTELNVGRVQGNELMLPKGNVSKRHARLLFRDGRFIVTDLNSTNGTYVNRRRIAQATIVREGDRIYIGDFVLRIEFQAIDTFDEKTGSTGRPSFTSVPDRASSSDAGLKDQSGERESLEDKEQSSERPSLPSSGDAAHTPGRAARLDSDGPTPNLAVRERIASPDPGSEEQVEHSVASKNFATAAARHRTAVHAIVSHVLASVGEEEIGSSPSAELAQRVRELAHEQARRLAEAHELASELAPESVANDAVAELLDMGPLVGLLADASVSNIAIPRYDQMIVTRAGRLMPMFPTFSCPWSLNAALQRLADRAQGSLASASPIVDFRLPDGTTVSGVRGEAAPTGTLLVIRKPRRITSTLEKLVRRGAISRAIATFLEQCVAARLNLLIVGPRDEGASTLLSALAAATTGEHLVALSASDDVVAHTDAATRLNLAEVGHDAVRLIQVAARIPEARLIASLSDANLAAAAIQAIGDGIDGVLASFRAADLRRALARLPADLTLVRAGMNLDAAREWVRSAFDVVIEVARLRDGRIRVLRVAEFARIGPEGLELSDIFRFVVERVATGGAIEGSFLAGDRPRVVEQMNALGIETDPGLFSRTQSR